jgi:hypothetical protein
LLKFRAAAFSFRLPPLNFPADGEKPREGAFQGEAGAITAG